MTQTHMHTHNRQAGKVLLWIVLAAVVLIILFGVSSYNSLVKSDEAVTTAWSQVETQYQRRFDLIPNLVASTQAVLTQEREVFTAIAEARQGYAGAQTAEQKVQAAQRVESALSRLLVIVENYPQLKSNETVQAFMAQQEGTENRISVERSRYNEVVQSHNVKVRTFPGNIFASVFGFGQRTQFDATSGADVAPAVNFN